MEIGVSPYTRANTFLPIVYGYVFIPRGVNRDDYIQTCYNKCMVDVITDMNGSVISDCYVMEQVMQDLIFPENSDLLGSCVVMVSEAFKSKPVVIGTLAFNDEMRYFEEGGWRKDFVYGGGLFSLNVSPSKGVIDIALVGNNDGVMRIDVKGLKGKGEFYINASGKINVMSEGPINSTSYTLINSKIKDNEGNELVNNEITRESAILSIKDVNNNLVDVTVTPEKLLVEVRDENGNLSSIESNSDGKVVLNGGGEAAVAIGALTDRLNKLKDELNSFITVFNNHVHPAATTATVGTGSIGTVTLEKPSSSSDPSSPFSVTEYDDKTVQHPSHK